MHSTSSLDSIRNTIKAVDNKIEPLNEYIAVKEIQVCSLMARYFTPAVAKTSSIILGDGFEHLENAVEVIPGAKPVVMGVSQRFPSLKPIYQMLAGEVSLNNALKPDLFDKGILAPSSISTIQDNAVSLVLLSMLAYEDEENVKAKIPDWHVNYFQKKKLDTEGYVLQKGNIVVIAFRGTEGFNSRDWSTDFEFALAPLTKKGKKMVKLQSLISNTHPHDNIQVHVGFQKALNAVKKKIRKRLEPIKNHGNPNIELYVTGHSLGGALADLCVGQMLAENSDETSQWMKRCFKGLYTYGQPRVGNEEYCQLCTEIDNQMFRFVLAHDIVPRMPLLDTRPSNYVHHGTLVYMQPNGKVAIISNPCGTHDHEQVHLLLGWFDQTVKTVQNWKKDSLFRKIVRFILPYSLNDHLPSDYVEAVMGVDQPLLKRNVFEEPKKKQTEASQ